MIETLDPLYENQLLREENQKKDLLIAQQNFRIEKLEQQIQQLVRHIYGEKSEKFVPVPSQGALFELPALKEKERQKQTITYEREKPAAKNNHKGRLPLPDHLPRVDEVREPKEDVSGFKKIGEEITEVLECEPGRIFVRRIIRPKYARENNEGVAIADLPSSPIEKGRAGASILALIIIYKFVDHLPLYRQIEMFKRMGIDIPPSTMSDWIKMAAELITPLYEALLKKILESNYLQVDETRIQVLDRDKKKKTHRGWYWTYRDPVSGLVLFDYHESRGREGPETILKNYSGFLQTDGYEVYNQLNKNKDNITLLHCMAHARRYFEKAKNDYKESAEYFLTEVQKLYAVEKRARENNLSHSERYELRQQESIPVLQSLHSWLKENVVKQTPKSLIGEAIAYALPRWEKLTLYCTDGKLEIDNNLVENVIRPIAIGRKNYLFAGSHEAAQNAAMFYSLLGTCKLKGIEPFEWLKSLFEILPDWKANRLEELLP